MAKLTAFGLEVRMQRMHKDISLSAMAKTIGVTASFVSGIEVGRRPIPKDYVKKVINALQADPNESDRLIQAADKSRAAINIEHVTSQKGKALVGELARKANDLTQEQYEEIEKIISSLPFAQNREPFKREKGHRVSPQTYTSIWNRTEIIYKDIPKTIEGVVDIKRYLENLHVYYPEWCLDVVDNAHLLHEEGRTDITNKIIQIREDTWKGLENNNPRARFTACHELGHLILHSHQTITMSRGDHKIFEDAEWQADVFAGSLLMPASQLQKLLSSYTNQDEIFNAMSEDIPQYFGISYSASGNVINQYQKKGRLTFKNERLFLGVIV